MKKIILISVALICCSLGSVEAQQFRNQNGVRQFTNDLYQLDEYIKRRDAHLKGGVDYLGTPYNYPEYLPGNVYSNDKLLATNVGLRYNATADEIEIKESVDSPDEDARMLTKSPDIFVKIDNRDIFIFLPFEGNIEKGGYFQVLYEGTNYSLFKKLIKEYEPGKPASTSLTKDIPAKFVDKSVYHIVLPNGRLYEMPSSKAKKLKVFGSKKEEIRKYVESRNLDINKDEDLASVIRYYDTMNVPN